MHSDNRIYGAGGIEVASVNHDADDNYAAAKATADVDPDVMFKRGFHEGMEHANRVRRTTFSDVLHRLKETPGRRFAREGWNGRGMYIFLHPGRMIHAGNNPDLASLGVAFPDGKYAVHVLPHIMLRTVTGDLVPWLASQTDLLADDWMEAKI